MRRLACLWNRSRLERYTDGALTPRRRSGVARHLGRCPGCRREAERLAALRALVRSAGASAAPDWTGFWPSVRTRILSEAPEPMGQPWWRPIWNPVWAHPRLAAGGVLAAALAVALTLWPIGEPQPPRAWAGPVLVQNVGTSDPGSSVMVYSSQDHGVTVIWLFKAPDPGS
jgi:anti-sigma factor RsiW